MQLVKAGGRQYELYDLTGEVIKCEKRILSHATGKGERGYRYNGSRYTSAIMINTNHIVRGQVFLRDSGGNEHIVNLADFDLDCREGHCLNIVWAIQRGHSTGPYIAVKNLHTGSRHFNNQELTKMHRPSALPVWNIAIVVLPVGYITGQSLPGFIIAALVVLVGSVINRSSALDGAKNFKSRFSFDG